MQVRCAHCEKHTEYTGDAPRFCSHCGQAFEETDFRDDETISWTRKPGTKPSGQSVGSTIAGYRLNRELGRGGMGVVFAAEEEGSGRQVALKLLPGGLDPSDETVQRFLREGQIAASLSHPRSTFVYTAGEEDGQFYIAMELMSGGTLRDVVDKEGALPVGRAVDYILEIIDGLSAAHALGVIHRDVKPPNCFLDHDGRAKVGDFGISKSLFGDADLTRTGAFMGTPQYAAPEQIRAGKIDARTDIYAVGATLFYLLAGRAAFVGDAVQVVADIASQPAPSIGQFNKTVPRELQRIIASTQEKEPDKRPQSLADLRTALLPYSTQGSSIADVGRRFAAFSLDSIAVGIVGGITSVMLVMVLAAAGQIANMAMLALMSSLGVAAISIGYFTFVEGRWGGGMGKALLGLRVVGPQGELPGYGRALIRALILPGTTWLVVRIIPALWGGGVGATPVDLEGLSPFETVVALLTPQLYTALAWGIGLLCLITMRRANGYRGIHELASGTRVIRIRSSHVAPPMLPITVPVFRKADQTVFGDYRIVGDFSTHPTDTTVHLAQDQSLDRAVWMLVGDRSATEFDKQRRETTRPTRLRWLQNGQQNGHSWCALEAMHGTPLSTLLADKKTLQWEHARVILLELAEELLAAVSDETLPASLNPDQVWVSRDGHVKLLDVAVRDPAMPNGSATTAPSDQPPDERACQLFQYFLTRCAEQCELTGNALDFASASASRPDNVDKLQGAIESLKVEQDRPSQLTRDDRLGLLAISFGVEQTIYYALCFIVVVVLASYTNLTIVALLTLASATSLSAAVATGALVRGGLVFRLAHVQVRRNRGDLAGPLRRAWRNVAAWGPAILGFSMMASYLIFIVTENVNVVSEDNATVDFNFLVMFWPAAATVPLFVHIAGAVLSFLNPSRGIQDFLAGTKLVVR